jgi:hypothetical protein
VSKRLLWLLLGGAILVAVLRFALDPPRPQRPRQLPPPAAVPASPRPAEALPKLLRDPFLSPAEEAALARGTEPSRAVRPPVRPTLRVEALVVPSDGRSKVAIVNGRPYAEGERIGEETLAVISADHIELVSPAGARRTLSFDEGQTAAWPVSPEKRVQRP